MLPQALKRIWRRWELRRRVSEELRFHYEEALARNRDEGLPEAAARAAAAASIGNRKEILRQCLADLEQELSRPFEPRRHAPPAAWGAAALLAPPLLAWVFIPHHLRPLPLDTPEQLEISGHSTPLAQHIAEQEPLRVAAHRRALAHLAAPGGEGALVAGRLVSRNFFELQGAAPAWGAGFSRAPESQVILSYRAWRQHFSDNPVIIGGTVEIDGRPHRVAGIMGPDYWFLGPRDAYWSWDPSETASRREMKVLVRRMPGESRRVAEISLGLSDYRFQPLSSQSRALPSAALALAGSTLALLAALGLLQTWTLTRALGGRRVPFQILLRNYLFLFAKAIPVVAAAAVFWVSSSETFLLSSFGYFGGVWTLFSTFVLCLACVAATWQSLVDQRLRCPICLRKLSMPLPLGVIGSILFHLPGTEYICAWGHGTMYIPEPTSEGLRDPRWSEPSGLWAELMRPTPASRG